MRHARVRRDYREENTGGLKKDRKKLETNRGGERNKYSPSLCIEENWGAKVRRSRRKSLQK